MLHLQYENYKAKQESVDLINQKYHDLKHQIAVLRSESGEERNAVLDRMEQEIKAYEAQNDTGNKHSPTVIIASITSKKDAKPKFPTHYYIGIEAGLELPSIVLLEQLRTVDKRRLNEFIGHLPEKHIQGINHALAVSIGLIDSVPKKLILCLCSTCANNFYGSGAFALRRVDPAQTEKDTCTYCNSRKGFDYEVIPKAR